MNRYFSGGLGRFLTADHYRSGEGAGSPADPASWNRYSYTEGDPANEFDPRGEFMLQPQIDWTYFLGALLGFPQVQTPARADPSSAFPECNPKGNPATEKRLNWISNNWGSAIGEANVISSAVTGAKVDSDALATLFLEWSADESGYGTNAANAAENNFFGIQNKGNTAGLFGGTTVVCNRDGDLISSNSTNACFASSVDWGQELGIALGITSSKTGVTYLSALEGALGNGANMTQAIQAIAGNGWNADPSYARRITGIRLQAQADCLEKYGYIP